MSEEQGLAVREQPSGAAIVKGVLMPKDLQDAGVRIVEEEGTGMRAVVLPPAVRAKVNLLTPVSSFSQSDPNWSPAVTLVKLDKESHTYPITGGAGKLGLNKQALETLGQCAGVLYVRTSRVPTAELAAGELFAYKARVGFRRADGTVREVEAERGFDKETARAEIELDVEGHDRFKAASRAVKQAEVDKRWTRELKFARGKTESKAINRALRAGLAMPTSVQARDLEKPFLVVGFNFTPDYNDPVVKRALVAIGLNAGAAIYDAPALAPAEPVYEAPAEIELVGDDEEDSSAGQGASAAGENEEAVAGVETEGLSAGDVSSDDEPSFGDDPPIAVPDAAVDEAGRVVATTQGKTVAEAVALAVEGDEKAIVWIQWKRRQTPDAVLAALELYATHRAPAVWDIT